MKLLLVEDDPAIRLMLTEAFTLQHWGVEPAPDGLVGLELGSRNDYDLILLDIGLPKLDGIAVCKQLRSRGCQTPILLLTGQDSPEAQVVGLDAGADDYITKPFNLEVVLARVRAVARKGKSVAPVLTWDNLQVNSTSGEVSYHDQMIHLTAKEFGLLELFLLNPKRIYSRRAILDQLWDMADSPGEETVSTHIKCVRQKLKAAGAADPFETVHGLGYRLRAEPSAQPAETAKGRRGGEGQPPQDLPVNSPQPESTLADQTSPQTARRVTARVWNQFKAQYWQQVETLAAFVEALTPGVASSQQQEIQYLAHKLVGSLGMFGLLSASQQARDLEQLMKASVLDAVQIAQAAQWVEGLKQTLLQAQDEPPAQVQAALGPDASRVALILIVDDDHLLAERLRIEAIAWNVQVEVAPDLAVARQMIDQAPPSLILLDLGFPGAENGLMLMRELMQHRPEIPVVVFTAGEDLRDRVAAAQLGASAFLQKPLPTCEILKTVTDVLQHRTRSSQDRVLIVDDDPAFLALLSGLLANHGIEVTGVSQPQQFWQVLEHCRPKLLLLDLEMPEFNGLELCQVVRTDPQWQHLTVLFISAHTEADRIAQAYTAGADDYLSKTLPETELVSRILNRIKRQR